MARIQYHPLGPGNWPLTSAWRTPSRPNHRGVDIGVVKSPLYASVTGRATHGSEPNGAGWWVNIISDDGRILTKCFHMSRIDIDQNERVTAGQRIGTSGGVPGEPGAGNTTGAHLHYEIWEGGRDTDPAPDLTAVSNPPKPVPPTPPFPQKPLEDPMTKPAVYSGQRPQDDQGGIWADPGDGRLRRVADTAVLAVLRAKDVLPDDETACDPQTLVGIVDFYNYDPPGVD
jgi:murein DD-endopeptidase MepM/ murein hydrolase activator NlpD